MIPVMKKTTIALILCAIGCVNASAQKDQTVLSGDIVANTQRFIKQTKRSPTQTAEKIRDVKKTNQKTRETKQSPIQTKGAEMFDFFKKKKKSDTSKNERVIRFDNKHNLGLDCYNASDLHLAYGRFGARRYASEENDGKRILANSKKEGHATDANMGTFEVFRDVVKLRWLDHEGNPIAYQFRFEDIFKDKIIPHIKEDEDLIYWDDPIFGIPGIIIEVDDRTLNIYSDVDIRLRVPNTNKLRHRRDHILVFSKTF